MNRYGGCSENSACIIWGLRTSALICVQTHMHLEVFLPYNYKNLKHTPSQSKPPASCNCATLLIHVTLNTVCHFKEGETLTVRGWCKSKTDKTKLNTSVVPFDIWAMGYLSQYTPDFNVRKWNGSGWLVIHTYFHAVLKERPSIAIHEQKRRLKSKPSFSNLTFWTICMVTYEENEDRANVYENVVVLFEHTIHSNLSNLCTVCWNQNWAQIHLQLHLYDQPKGVNCKFEHFNSNLKHTCFVPTIVKINLDIINNYSKQTKQGIKHNRGVLL